MGSLLHREHDFPLPALPRQLSKDRLVGPSTQQPHGHQFLDRRLQGSSDLAIVVAPAETDMFESKRLQVINQFHAVGRVKMLVEETVNPLRDSAQSPARTRSSAATQTLVRNGP